MEIDEINRNHCVCLVEATNDAHVVCGGNFILLTKPLKCNVRNANYWCQFNFGSLFTAETVPRHMFGHLVSMFNIWFDLCFLRFLVQLHSKCATTIILNCYRSKAYRALSMQVNLIEFDKYYTIHISAGTSVRCLHTEICLNLIRIWFEEVSTFNCMFYIFVLVNAFNYEFA